MQVIVMDKNEMDCCGWRKISLIGHHKWRMHLQCLLFSTAVVAWCQASQV